MTTATEIPATISAATADQPAARLALASAVADPFHAYLLAGPAGSGKRAAARALAAELLADGAPDPDDARRRALADPSPHPDLVWLRPPGVQHLVEEVRERVISAVAYRPFEGEHRVFVIEVAEAMAEESQNALLKTLEEPPPFAHLILVSAEPEALLETVRSRCRTVAFARLAPEAIEARLEAGGDPTERRAVSRLCGGDADRARFLLAPEGSALRAAVEELARSARSGELADAPWLALATAAEQAGELAAAGVRTRAAEAEEGAAERSGPPPASAPAPLRSWPSAPRVAPAPGPSTSASPCSAPGFAISPQSVTAPQSSPSTATASPSCNATQPSSTRGAPVVVPSS